MRETLRHKEAFEFYYGLGSERNIIKVAAAFQCSDRSVAGWSKNFNWQERVEQRDIENGRRLEKRTNDTVVAAKADYRKIVRAAIARWVEQFKNGVVDIKDTRDLERLVKLDLLLMGEAPERLDVRDEHESERIRRLVTAHPEVVDLLFGDATPQGEDGTGTPPGMGEVR